MIPGNNHYQVSNYGRVYSLYTNKLLSFQEDIHGYYRAAIYKSKKVKKEYVHRLVAKSFLPNPQNAPVVNHLDGNKKNNMVSNLEWATLSENTQHAYDNQLCKRGSKNVRAKLTSQQAREIKLAFLDGEVTTKLAEKFGIGPGEVVAIAKGRSYRDETADIPNSNIDLKLRKSVLIAESRLTLWGVKQLSNGLWNAVLTVNGRRYLDADFTTKEEAYAARIENFKWCKERLIKQSHEGIYRCRRLGCAETMEDREQNEKNNY